MDRAFFPDPRRRTVRCSQYNCTSRSTNVPCALLVPCGHDHESTEGFAPLELSLWTGSKRGTFVDSLRGLARTSIRSIHGHDRERSLKFIVARSVVYTLRHQRTHHVGRERRGSLCHSRSNELIVNDVYTHKWRDSSCLQTGTLHVCVHMHMHVYVRTEIDKRTMQQ